MPPNPSPPMSSANTTSPASTNAFLAHLLSQTRSNIDFLVSQGYITQREAAGIGARLRSLQEEADVEADGNETSLSVNERIQPEVRAPSPAKAVLPVARRNVPPPPSASSKPALPQAKALWDYNVDSSDANDLTFRAGDIIDIVSETNEDWWTGRLANDGNPREGLFPSNYVEKLVSPPNAPPVPIPEPTPRPVSHMSNVSGTPGVQTSRFPVHAPPPPPAPPYVYSPNSSFQAPTPWVGRTPTPLHQHSGSGYYNEKPNSYTTSGPQPQAGPVAPPAPPPPTQQEPEKKGKFSGLGNTMANSAAGGVGFGAGAAIGSGLINAIF